MKNYFPPGVVSRIDRHWSIPRDQRRAIHDGSRGVRPDEARRGRHVEHPHIGRVVALGERSGVIEVANGGLVGFEPFCVSRDPGWSFADAKIGDVVRFRIGRHSHTGEPEARNIVRVDPCT